jgi:tetratricopeptide (TPR) repeat protein
LSATSIESIGVIYHEQGKLQKALNYYKQALKIQRTIYPYANKLMAKTLTKLGDTNRNLNNCEQALSDYKEAYDILTQYSNIAEDEINYLKNMISELQDK